MANITLPRPPASYDATDQAQTRLIIQKALSGGPSTAIYTVGTLPLSAAQGTRALVGDASSPTFLATPTGGGSIVAPVFFSGSAWKIG